jgi:hypothetical protein
MIGYLAVGIIIGAALMIFVFGLLNANDDDRR